MATTPQFAASDLAGTFPRGEAPGLFEVCERRLVLSAQLLFDVLGDHALELHGDSSSSPPGELVPIDSHLREAHAASGWSTVQQQFGLTGKGQTVAVIDSGIAWDHVALGQGYGPGYRVVGGWDFTEENDAQPYDDGPLGFHGTHVSGIIGSSDAVHTGVAPDVDLVALRVFNDIGQGQLSWVERALQWVHDNRNRFENPITTVNLSLGTSWNSNELPAWATLEEELRTLYQDGIVVTASAGNSFQSYQTPGLSYPAASQYVLPVASVDDDGQLSNFSQRNDRVLAAPGSNIVSTVPDHVLGRDGKIDDFTAASGTSMAAPYVAGASVLVRQAMEMVDYAGINASSIADHLHATADSVYDALTGSSYDRLNLQQAIDTLLPDDLVGDSPASAAPLDLGAPRLEGWINTLGDQDVYRFTAAASGSLHLDAGSEWLDTLQWSLQSAGQQIQSGGLEPAAVQLIAGQTYELLVSANREIGSFSFDLDFQLAGGGQGTGESVPPGDNPINLGPVAYKEQTLAAGSQLRVQAVHDGIFTVQWTAPDQPAGAMSVSSSAGDEARDATWSHGALRIDLPVVAGQWLDIRLPDSGGGSGELALAGVLSQLGSTLQVQGTMNGDELAVSLQDGLQLRFGKIEYAYPAGAISHLQIEAQGSNDRLHLLGSPQSDQVELRPGG
ncbi:MAG: S8 family serine peptidase, partial [Planctomycetales bacterium]|nr:S8 family serine peptidase [Planctomycetales bacterium]